MFHNSCEILDYFSLSLSVLSNVMKSECFEFPFPYFPNYNSFSFLTNMQ